jgi:hypothetical protein
VAPQPSERGGREEGWAEEGAAGVTLQRLAIDFRAEELIRSPSIAAKPIALQGRGRRPGPEGGSGAHPREGLVLPRRS